MIIKRLKLNNIRSYVNEEITFPLNSILLSGDIGSGKTTILLAIDFALFGIQRGELSGSSLLRNGVNEGYVSMDFKLGDKNLSIKRILKRSSAGITQSSGFLDINDITKELTTVELKQAILELLNYPQEALTKKNLIFRYTVYTPQDEMKSILLNDPNVRLETLRRVFNVDKYKRILNNAMIISSHLKSKKKEFVFYISDLVDKTKLLDVRTLELSKLTEELNDNSLILNDKKEKLENKKENFILIEKEIEKLNNLRKENSLINLNIKNKIELVNKNKIQFEELNNLILSLEKELQVELNPEKIKSEIDDIKNKVKMKQEELRKINFELMGFKHKKEHSFNIKIKITNLNFCPTCNQNVNEEHKKRVNDTEDKNIGEWEKSIINLSLKEKELDFELEKINSSLNGLNKKEREISVLLYKKHEMKNKKESLDKLKLSEQETIKELDYLKLTFDKLGYEIDNLKNIESKYLEVKKSIDELLTQEKCLELNVAVSKTKITSIENETENLKQEIEKKSKIRNKLEYYNKLQLFLDKEFSNILTTIELNIMMKLHNDFSNLFKKWFSMLIDPDVVQVDLTEDFAPMITQNKHDISYNDLSGGEKTACALSYRLALNQIINKILNTINTKDLIILDEPTDGFSNSQLERMKDIINSLEMSQVILVSHDDKIESFVDNIIRIKKVDHISTIY